MRKATASQSRRPVAPPEREIDAESRQAEVTERTMGVLEDIA